MNGPDLFADYKKLLAKVDAFASRLTELHRPQITCCRGCADCCRQDLHLLPVELYYLREGLPGTRLQAAAPTLCPLLRDGGCRLYERRPIICRTHGLPLLVTENGRTFRDCCPRNFSGRPLADLPADGLLHLEKLNLILVAVNMAFAAAAGIKAGRRMPISALANAADRGR